MLHVFNVNRGTMLTFDVNLAMERVLELKTTIQDTHGISPDKQVMLISGGQALSDEERVCSYAAGTESNPVYLFDKGCIEKENLQLQSNYQESNDFAESIRNARTLSPSYKTVEVRTKLAMRLHDATRHQAQTMKSLVHDEHLMFQGWQAAVSNLMDTVRGFQTRVETMCSQCQKLFEQGRNNAEILKGMDTILKSLEQIPILPTLLKSIRSDQQQVTLLHWIKSQCKNVSVQVMYNECKQKQDYLNQERYKALLEECSKVDSQASNVRMSEISGINERLSALDHLILTAEQQVKEQTGIAQGFVRNRETARELHNNSPSIDALLTLCESHITQLQIMSEYESMTRDALHKCTHAKNELAANLHTRLRWLYVIQRSILNVDVKLSMFTQQLSLLQRQVTFLDQVKQCPTLYLSSVAEVVRRKQFADNYIQCANRAVAEARVERDREIVKRKTFQSNLSGHFIQRLFHGLSDKPPSLSKKPMRNFDNNLPNITLEHLNTLSKLLPDYKDILEVQEQSTMKPKWETYSNMSDVQSTSLVSPSTSTLVQSNLDTFTASSQNTDSLSQSMSITDKDKERSTTGSFAMVGHSSIAKSQPGGFVVTSVENVTRIHENEDISKNENQSERFQENVQDLSQRNYPSLDRTVEHQHSPPTSPGEQDQPDSIFAQIGDIISPDSPPDSEFFSIMPGSFGNNRTLTKPSLDSQPGSSLTGRLDVINIRRRESLPRSPRKQSLIAVGSPDSNTSTSYQKVDGISSDEEMFHSFSSDHQDVKQLRKKLHQLQTDYDNLTQESKLEKEELNILIRKLQQEISSLEENQRKIESDYEKRWQESKSELDNVIKQLENERLERKKAWSEGANLEKKIKTLEEEKRTHSSELEMIQNQVSNKNLTIEKLENEVKESEDRLSSAMEEAERKIAEIIRAKESQYEKELQTVKSASLKFERELALAQTELSTSEDRIQELETALSDRERRQQEDASQVLEFETKICELERELGCTRESFQKSTYEKSEAKQQILDHEQKLAKAHDQIESLKRLLVDYETKINDDKTKDHLLKNLKLSVHDLELEKSELTSNLESSKKEIEKLKNELSESEKTAQNLRSIGAQDEKSYKEEIEKLKRTHADEIKSTSEQHGEEIVKLTEKHENEIKEITQEHEKIIIDKEQYWKGKEETLSNAHRNEIDELEADRLASIASAQQSIEDLREKLREANRTLDIRKKEFAESKDSFAESHRKLEEDYSRIISENENLVTKISEMEQEISQYQEEIRKHQEQAKQDVAMTTMITSSSSTDEEMKSKRSKIDSGISDDLMVSSSVDGLPDANGNPINMMTMSVVDHKKKIDEIKKNFDEDKKALQNLFKKEEEESARRRQMVFNSAIQRVASSKDIEIEKLKEQLMSQSRSIPGIAQSMMVQGSQPMSSSITHSSTSPSSLGTTPDIMQASTSGLGKTFDRDKDKAAVVNFQIGDNVLVCFNDTYQHFTLLTTSRTLHFVHAESLDKLGINSSNPESKKSMTFATLVDKEYCQARKAQNRFRVPINTKFYRVKVTPFAKKDLQS
uniref:RB1-inducible coiled-coil protein 1-like n=1 Tax=Styela clava TaxID=7725 RepID=UPI0019394940|nr:RB1-inducible coiled-coil protein 1-like [Styela clava]